MADERERGRINGLRTKHKRMYEHALAMVAPFKQARVELSRAGERPSFRAYADWLNANGYKTVNLKVWRGETVSRLFEVAGKLVQQANDHHKRERALVEFQYRRLLPAERKQREEEKRDALAALVAVRDREIGDARTLHIELNS